MLLSLHYSSESIRKAVGSPPGTLAQQRSLASRSPWLGAGCGKRALVQR